MGSWESTESHSSPHGEACRCLRGSATLETDGGQRGDRSDGGGGAGLQRRKTGLQRWGPSWRGCARGQLPSDTAWRPDETLHPTAQGAHRSALRSFQARRPSGSACRAQTFLWKHVHGEEAGGKRNVSAGLSQAPAGTVTQEAEAEGQSSLMGWMAFLDSSQPARARRHTAGDPEAPALSPASSADLGGVWKCLGRQSLARLLEQTGHQAGPRLP